MRPIARCAARCAAAAFWLSLLLAPSTALAAAGQTGFAWLMLGVGARPMGMGGAYVALAEDPTALYWNPAGLARVRSTQVTAMHNEWIQDFRQEYAAVGTPLGAGSVGFSFAGFYSGSSLDGRDGVGNPTGDFGFNDIGLSAAYARPLARGLDGGLVVRYLQEMIDQKNASTVAADLGARYDLGTSGLSLGAAAQNIGGKPKFIDESFKLPMTFRAGAALTRPLSALHSVGTVTAELRKIRSLDARFNLGGELIYKDRLALRAGGKFGYDTEKAAFGVGIIQRKFRFDYALVPMSEDLGTTHFFSVTAKL